MSETRQIINLIISDFSIEKFNLFFRRKTQGKFREIDSSYRQYEDSNFINGIKLGEAEFEDGKLLVCAFEVQKSLSEKSGKKDQYEKAKNILKSAENQFYSAGIFVFYDQSDNFRFSLVYPESIGTRRQWNQFKRYTYFVSKEFTNKTFLQRIGDGDFSTLAKIKEAFSIEKVTKEFYQDIANWYFWAVSNCKFPKDAESNIAVIRLITRMIFIWFMRERGLINKDLFKKDKMQEILKSLDDDESNYYKAILQNLFFATLSTKKEERQFGSEIRGYKGHNPDFNNQYVFRYQEMFKNPENIKDYFDDIPFLNGGLFECLDDKKNGIIIDGFSRTKKNQPEVPNFLFFETEKNVDLNKVYGTKNKTYKVRGLLDILSSFNFTIDENSPDDADIALDPELLGRVFENLLASFNPETSTTARKATGSYYTPREIVDYMVAESLKAYFKTHLIEIAKIDEKLEQLFSNAFSDNPFDERQSQKLVAFIESIKIVDPAVGSGAFPMGALNKLVFILNKVDPGNKLWKEAQLKATDAISDPRARRIAKERIEEFFESKNADYGRKLYLIQRCIYGVDIQQIAVEIAKLRFFISLLVDETVDKTKDNWGIEPLPNLDFKIMQGNSLISEFLGIDFDNGNHKQEQGQVKLLPDQDDGSLIKEFEQKKIDFQNEADKDKKAKLKQEIENLMIQIFENKVKKQKSDYFRQLEEIENKYSALPNKNQREEIIAQEKQKLSKKSGFDLENIEKQLREFTSKKKTRPFFPWKLYFAEVFEKGGFDIVVGNPPYIGEKGHKELFREVKNGGSLGRYYQGKMDYFYFFFHLALNLGNNHSQIAFITTNYYLTASGARELREDFKNRATINKLVNFNELKIFETATGQHNMITILSKGQDDEVIATNCITKRTGVATPAILASIVSGQDEKTDYFKVAQKDLYDGENYNIRIAGTSTSDNDPIQTTLDKIKKQGVLLGTICNVNQGIVTGADKVSQKHIEKYKINANIGDGIFVLNNEEIKNLNLTETEKQILKPWFKNSDIKEYFTKENTKEYLIDFNYTSKPDINNYPNIKLHLLRFKDFLENRPTPGTLVSAFSKGMWWVLTTSRQQNFNLPKIVAPQRSLRNTFGYNEIPWYASADVYFITQSDNSVSLKYVLALLNSNLYYFWLYYRGKRKGEALELYQKPLSEIPIKKIPEQDQKPFIEIVDKILAITKSADYLQNLDKQAKVREYENQINELVYKRYNLTDEEKNIIKNSLNNK